MAVRRVAYLNCGEMSADSSMLIFRHNIGTRLTIPVTAAVLDTDDGYILFDTGFHPAGLTDPDILGGYAEACRYTEDNLAVNQLAKLGLKPEDIRVVVSSHLHFDHTGGNCHFGHARFLVQRAEWRWAASPEPFLAGAYRPGHYDLNSYELLEGSQRLFDGVWAFLTPGHTPGHQVLLVQKRGGTIILTGDACYTEENLERCLPDGNGYDRVRNMESQMLLKTLAEMQNAELKVMHDPRFFARNEAAPRWYE
ncbi:N-acyl homoserine lactonase family protein [Desulfovibrio sp. OttesenSCG-928-O18]|nr:N-acyl homoserine lactonase family protein [Desulfovibrio sp. OttesenSCG-928-O18]